MQVVYEDDLFKNRKSLILRHNTENQSLAVFRKKRQLCKNCCRRVVGGPVTNRFVVGKNMVVYEIESDYPTS